jgi:cytochrome c oxidase cbb3-type subunit I/II
VIFAFVGNMMFAGIYYSTQRLCKARMASDCSPTIHFWGWQLIIVAAAITLPLGLTRGQGVRGAHLADQHRRGADLGRLSVNFFWTLAKRNEPSSTSRCGSTSPPSSPWRCFTSSTTSRSPRAGRTATRSSRGADGLVQWWYGHNAVAFFLTTPILGIMYYFLPKAAERPVYSYRLSIVHFWSLVFIYIWAGPASPAEHRAAEVAANAGHVLQPHALGAELGRHAQRPAHPAWCLGQAAHRSGDEVLHRWRHLLRHVHL